jgi:putative sterol carrier protein
LSDEWLAEAAALTGSVDSGEAVCVIEQVVRHRDRAVRYQLHVANNAARIETDLTAMADVEMAEDYDVAAAISRGELDPGSALASGRVTIRGDAGRLAAVADALAGLGDLLGPLRARTEY